MTDKDGELIGFVLTHEEDADPDNFADAIEFVVEYLDITDKLLTLLGKQYGREGEVAEIVGDEVQTDLRSAVAWLRAHPEISTEIWDYVKSRRGHGSGEG